ncbi:MAG: glycosyltransferase 87 family protein [Solirubrobacteraceae bacterium]
MRRLLLPAAVLVALWATVLVAGPLSDTRVNDLYLYGKYARALNDGAAPYRDLALEYPPLALAPIRLAALPSEDPSAYRVSFAALMLGAMLAMMVLTARLAEAAGGGPSRHALTAAWLVALSPLVCGAMLRTHFDLLPAAILLAALLALARDRSLLGFALLGVGAMTKLFPALVVPIAVAWLVGRGRTREALLGLAAFAFVLLAVSAPFAGQGYFDAYTFHLERPVQIESGPASVVWALGGSCVTGDPVRPDQFKSNGLDGGVATEVTAVFLIAQVAALGWIVLRVARRPEPRALVLAAFAAVLAFAALGKVLSPQFVIWLVPFAALAWAWGERTVAALCAGAMALTLFEFPVRYWDLVDGDPGIVAIVGARNALLGAALVTLLAREAGAARSRSPVVAPSPG